jgi:hypothetical protein
MLSFGELIVLLHPTQDDTKMTTAVMASTACLEVDFLAKNNIGRCSSSLVPLRIEDVANMAWLSVDLV